MKILVVDDEKNIRATLKNILEDEGFQALTTDTGEKALSVLSKQWIDLVILDVKLPGIDGIQVFKEIKTMKPCPEVLMISGHSGIKTAVEAVKLGAYDFLEKPLSMAKILTAIRNIGEKRKLLTKIQQGEWVEESKYRLVGKSLQMEKLLDLIRKVAPTNSKILIRGESGTGKELVAYAIHQQSRRKEEPFIKFNSAAIPNELVESELFGHEKGAFTGADQLKLGKLEIANNGTLFLDEIGDMNLSAQAKILRVIQEGMFERVGSNQTIEIDVRIIAATHKNLEEMIQEGTFREDLYYRLNVVPINIPSLREREGDIEVLVNYFLEQFANEFNVETKKMSKEAIEYLNRHSFPGNVRELKNLIERLYILIDTDLITDQNISTFLSPITTPRRPDSHLLETQDFKLARKQFEIRYLTTQLEKYKWNISVVAKQLGIHQPNLSRKIKDLRIEKI